MSEEFIQYTFPCDKCLVQAACQDYDKEKVKLKNVRSNRPSLALPAFDPTKKTYHKVLMECWANIGRDILDAVSKTEDPTRHQKTDNLPMPYVHILWAMSQIMCHIVNTTSWRKGELYEFDRMEIKRRLEKLKGWL